MAFTYKIERKFGIGTLKFVSGTFENGSSDTGGTIKTGFLKVLFADVVFSDAQDANTARVQISGGNITITTDAGSDGYWFAIGY